MNENNNKVTIFVNGVLEEVEKKEEITYTEVVTYAFPDFPKHPEVNYSVKYTRGHGDKPDGILPPGGQVKVKDQMRFDVAPTGQS